MQEFRPSLVDERVDDQRVVVFRIGFRRDDRRFRANAANGAGRFFPPFAHVEKNEFAHPRNAVVAGNDRDEFRRFARNGARVKHRVRPIGVRAVKRVLVRAVRVHLEEKPRVRVRNVGVFPTLVKDSAVFGYRRMPVVFLVERQAANRLLFVGVHSIRVRNAGRPVDARHRDVTGARRVNDRLVRQVASVVRVGVGQVRKELFSGRSDDFFAVLFQFRFENVPLSVFARRAEEDFFAVEVQVDVADERRFFRTVNFARNGRITRRTVERQSIKSVVKRLRIERAVADPVVDEAEMASVAPHEENIVEVEERVRAPQTGIKADVGEKFANERFLLRVGRFAGKFCVPSV